MTTNPSILSEAADIVGGSRQADYGTPLANHSRTAALWSAYLGIPVTARQVCMMNVLQKVSRDVHAPKRDNLVDIAGYAENAHLCEEARRGVEQGAAKTACEAAPAPNPQIDSGHSPVVAVSDTGEPYVKCEHCGDSKDRLFGWLMPCARLKPDMRTPPPVTGDVD